MLTGYDDAYSLMGEIFNNFSAEDKEWFLNEPVEAMHLSLGMHLRNHAHLWSYPWEPELVDGVDYSPKHPDVVSSKVIKDFQRNKRNTLDWLLYDFKNVDEELIPGSYGGEIIN